MSVVYRIQGPSPSSLERHFNFVESCHRSLRRRRKWHPQRRDPSGSLEGRGARGANVASGVITLLLFLFAFIGLKAARSRESAVVDRDATVYTVAQAKPPLPVGERQESCNQD